MLAHTLAHFPSEVQAGEFGVTLFQLCDDAQGLPVVVKATVILHEAGESHFTRMPERRMTEIVRETDRLDQVLVGAEGTCQRAPDLSHLQRVREAGAEIVAFVIDEYLRLVFEPAECCGVNDAVAVALKGCTVFRFAIQVGAPLGVLAAHPVGSQTLVLDLLKLLAGEIHDLPFRCKCHCVFPLRVTAMTCKMGREGWNPHNSTAPVSLPQFMMVLCGYYTQNRDYSRYHLA